jgi:SAM-dependent methyltransferase
VARRVRASLGFRARGLFHRLPEQNQARLRRLVRPVRWGGLRRFEPVDANWGYGRGTPVDRWYIERFIAQHEQDVRGRVLEVARPLYSKEHTDGITRIDILDVDPANTEATILADLGDADSLPRAAFDCVILTQTLQYLRDIDTALGNVWQSLVPGGVLLLSVPTTQKASPYPYAPELWRFTPFGLLAVLERACPASEREVIACGNLLAALSGLLGVAAEELRSEELERYDSDFVIITCARIRKPRESALP